MRDIRLRIAGNEFARMVRNPLVILLFGLLSVLLIINAIGSSVILPMFVKTGISDAFIKGVANTYYKSSLLFTFISMCIGVASIAEDRTKGSLQVLITKPLYRRDIIIGKLAGIGVLLFTLIIAVLLIDVSSIMIAFRGPESTGDMFLRMASYAAVLWLNCMLTVAITMTLGIIFKSLVEALIAVISYLYLGWYANLQFISGIGLINPMGLYNAIMFGETYNTYLFSEEVTYAGWLCGAAPFIALMIAEVAIFTGISCMLFNSQEI